MTARHRIAVLATISVLALTISTVAQAAEREPVDLFSAIDAGNVAVRLIQKDETSARIVVRNNTKELLSVATGRVCRRARFATSSRQSARASRRAWNAGRRDTSNRRLVRARWRRTSFQHTSRVGRAAQSRDRLFGARQTAAASQYPLRAQAARNRHSR
jgi:hypothetical protein